MKIIDKGRCLLIDIAVLAIGTPRALPPRHKSSMGVEFQATNRQPHQADVQGSGQLLRTGGGVTVIAVEYQAHQPPAIAGVDAVQ